LLVSHVLGFYVCKIVWPANLSSAYPTPVPLVLSNPVVLGRVLVTCGLIVGLLISLRWTRALAVGGLFFFVAILPTLGVFGYTWAMAADKYVYLPAVGVLMPLAWLLGWLWSAPPGRKALAVRRCATVAAVLVLAGLEVAGTRSYLTCWKDSESLARHMLEVGASGEAHNSLGLALMARGEYEAAVDQFDQAMRLRAGYHQAESNKAMALSALGRVEEAIESYEKALRLKPDHPRIHNNLANALMKVGRFDEAIDHYHEAIRLRPDYPKAYNNLGKALLEMGRVDEAIANCSHALELQPDFSTGHRFLADALLEKGRITEAVAHYREALQLDPQNAENAFGLGNGLARLGQLDEAAEAYRQALRLNPEHEEARRALEALSTSQPAE
jgi:tetratricopeptide (TPR) repeat protein